MQALAGENWLCVTMTYLFEQIIIKKKIIAE